MTRKLKALGLTMIAALAMSVVAASSAKGVGYDFHSHEAHALLTGSQVGTDVFTTDLGTVSCGNATYSGTTTSATTTEVTLTPAYSECEALFFDADINMNGCAYVFTNRHKVGHPNLPCQCPHRMRTDTEQWHNRDYSHKAVRWLALHDHSASAHTDRRNHHTEQRRNADKHKGRQGSRHTDGYPL
jgi:hypothetical protein